MACKMNLNGVKEGKLKDNRNEYIILHAFLKHNIQMIFLLLIIIQSLSYVINN